MFKIKPIISVLVKPPLRRIRNFIRYIPYAWGNERFCPICRKSSTKFGEAGLIPRDDAECLWCNSVERHRLVWIYLQRKTKFFDNKHKKMLHIAPEMCFEKLLKQQLGDGYLTADLYDNRAMVKMDVTNIQYSDNSFDVIYCSHVLEHIVDDKKAISEFFRVLKKDDWAIINVPITAGKTFEDPTITLPEERLKFFSQKDHVRRYGSDYIERLKEVGFKVTKTVASDFISQKEIKRVAVTKAAQEILLCTK